jgi:signal transduction histidine kinase
MKPPFERIATVAAVERLTLWERVRRVNPYVWDGLLAVAVLLISVLAGSSFGLTSEGVLEVRFFGGGGEGVHVYDRSSFIISDRGVAVHLGDDLPALLLIAAACIPLVWRRRAPIGTLVVTAIATAAFPLFGYGEGLTALALIVAAYTAAAHCDRGPVLIVVFPFTLAAGLSILLIASDPRGWLEWAAILMILVGLPLLFGRIAYNRRRRIRRDLEWVARDAVGEERARIARELHDVVAHAMGVMVVQAGAARVVIERDPASAANALQRIEDTGRTGLAEMRRLVGILQTDDEAALEPQPGLDQLDELLERMRETGLPVEATLEGTQRHLPPGVDLTAYRVVQEALTNALKHGEGARARVLLRYCDDALELEIADDGRGPPPDGTHTPGHGLIGMRERVDLFGGSLETGERRGGGFVVRATIPLSRTP